MANTDRRNILRAGLTFVAFPGTILYLGCDQAQGHAQKSEVERSPESQPTGNVETAESTAKGNTMQIQYLEIVTPEVDAVCETYSKAHGVTFKDADQSLGGARVAELAGGGMVGVRGPMRETETPVVRPYMLVDDIQAAIDAAAEAGAEVAMPPMEIPGHGSFAIFIQGWIESGLWQL